MTEASYYAYRLRSNPTLAPHVATPHSVAALQTESSSCFPAPPQQQQQRRPPPPPPHMFRAAGSSLRGSGVTVVAVPETTTSTVAPRNEDDENRPYRRRAPPNCRAAAQQIHLFATGSVKAGGAEARPHRPQLARRAPLAERPENHGAGDLSKERRQDMLRGSGSLW